MSQVNIFEQASRVKLRFESSRGPLTVEDLWTLKLEGRGDLNLDSIARHLNAGIQSVGEQQSFVRKDAPNNKALEIMKLKFDIVKHIIDIRLAEQEVSKNEKAKAELKRKIQDTLAKKQDEAFENKSAEELEAMLKEL